MFLKGRRCENQGLGIGAFSYYRRVVEHQKGRIIDEVIKVSGKIGAPEETLKLLREARNETKFSKSVSLIKDAIPQALLISGHNPLTLLHNALSAGLHEDTDDGCLSLAQAVRVVLVDLSERLSHALRDDAELKTAVSRLMKPNPSIKPPRSQQAFPHRARNPPHEGAAFFCEPAPRMSAIMNFDALLDQAKPWRAVAVHVAQI